MFFVDFIVLTNSSNPLSWRNCLRTIQTAKDADSGVFNVIVIDSSPIALSPDAVIDAKIDIYECTYGLFNYNRSINIAFKNCIFHWVVISNDDVSYERGWFSEILKVYSERPDIHSFSPRDPMLYALYYPHHFVGTDSDYLESYQVTEAVQGWCIVIRKESLNKIMPFDEQFDMYYQDNDYAEMLKVHGIKHALCRHSIAVHLNTANISKAIPPEKAEKMAIDEKKFREKWKIFS